MLLGLHVSRVHAKGARPTMKAQIEAARKQAEREGVDIKAVSLFVAGPRTQEVTLTEKEVSELKEYFAETKIVAIAHGTYADYPWKGNPVAASFIRKESDLCQAAGIKGLVVHLPNLPITPADVVKYLSRLYSVSRTCIYLEMIAGAPAKSSFETPEKIKDLFQMIREAKVDPGLIRTGLCIDTAHIWSSGVDISSYEGAEKWLLDLECYADIIPPDRIMIHLNDSLYKLGDGRDAHAPLLEGHIWQKYKNSPKDSGLAALSTTQTGTKLLSYLSGSPLARLPKTTVFCILWRPASA